MKRGEFMSYREPEVNKDTSIKSFFKRLFGLSKTVKERDSRRSKSSDSRKRNSDNDGIFGWLFLDSPSSGSSHNTGFGGSSGGAGSSRSWGDSHSSHDSGHGGCGGGHSCGGGCGGGCG